MLNLSVPSFMWSSNCQPLWFLEPSQRWINQDWKGSWPCWLLHVLFYGWVAVWFDVVFIKDAGLHGAWLKFQITVWMKLVSKMRKTQDQNNSQNNWWNDIFIMWQYENNQIMLNFLSDSFFRICNHGNIFIHWLSEPCIPYCENEIMAVVYIYFIFCGKMARDSLVLYWA